MTVRLLDALSAEAWRPLEWEEADGWVLRAAGGFSLRANSVWPRETLGARPLAERIDRAEAFYAARGLPVRFQISPASQPPALEASLSARSYAVHTPTDVMVAPIRYGPTALGVELSEAPTHDWRRVMLDSAADIADARGRLAIVDAIRLPRRHALVRGQGEPVAIGLGVLSHRWLGVFAMRTHPSFRRRGLAREIVRALLAWAYGEGARDAYLQVETDNPAAIALYRGLGFVRLYGYRYCTAAR
jgi:GNAT superfamily N-acetyltransferase